MMVLLAIVSLTLGIYCGQMIFSPAVSELFTGVADYTLYLLMFAVGISVGGNRHVFRKIREYHVRILIIPAGVITASVLSGFICAKVTGFTPQVSVPIAAGMGWYSLAGVMLTSMAGAKIGAVAFLSSLMREMISFAVIPPIAKYLNHYTAIAPAGATSEDTTLPMLIRCTSEEVAVMAVFNGVVCSAAVPILIRLFYRILA